MSIHARRSTVRRALFAALGVLSCVLAFVGALMPGLPTTVFVIAASYLFARSSPSCEAWLERNPLIGPSLHRFRETRGMPARSKAVALISMWAGVGASIYVLSDVSVVAQLLTTTLAIVGTATLLFYVRTAPRQSLILS